MTEQKGMTARTWAQLALLGVLWGGSYIANRFALDAAGVLSIVALRCLIAAGALWAFVAWTGLPVPGGPRAWGAFLVMGVFNNVVPFSLIVWGQMSIEAGLAAILNASTALFGVLVAAAAFRDERLTARKAAGVALGFAGVVVVIGPASLRSFDITSLAQLACLAATLSYALSGAFARVMLTDFRPEVATAGMLTASAAVLVPLALAVDGWPGAWPASAWGGILYLALAASVVAYVLFYRLLRVAGAGNTSLSTLLVAPCAIVLGALVFGETLPLRAHAGFALLAAGLVVLDGRLLARQKPAS